MMCGQARQRRVSMKRVVLTFSTAEREQESTAKERLTAKEITTRKDTCAVATLIERFQSESCFIGAVKDQGETDLRKKECWLKLKSNSSLP